MEIAMHRKVLVIVNMYELGLLFLVVDGVTAEQTIALQRITAIGNTYEAEWDKADLAIFDAINNRSGIFANAELINFNKELETKFDAVYAFDAPNIF